MQSAHPLPGFTAAALICLSNMSWRTVVISSNSKLDYKMNYLVVRNAESAKRIHIEEISVLLIESTAVSLTAYLLCELSKRKIDVIFCDEKRCPAGLYLPLYGSHDTALKLRNQVKWNEYTKQLVWAEVVRAKISGQAAVLKKCGRGNASLLEQYISEIEPGDPTNREGHAAKVYFNSLFGMEFSRSLDNNINAALNYGYGILLSAFVREIVANGYSTQLGIFHDNMFNHYNLACDLMEPFRPFIDCVVTRAELSEFGHSEKMKLVQALNRQIIIDGKTQYMTNAIKIFVKSIFDALGENDISKIRLPDYELQIYENADIF